ncbi:MAG TPA: hypothetical protein VIL36_07555, partial [Acidimicrobiales bacterium]
MATVPFLALAGGGIDGSENCPPAGVDSSPNILGPSTLSAAELQLWWVTTFRTQPEKLGTPIDDLFHAYLSEADAEGVRGDIA